MPVIVGFDKLASVSEERITDKIGRQRFTGREYQIAFDQFDARSLQELLRFLLDAEYEHYGFVTQDLEQALPASPHETIERSECKHTLTLDHRPLRVSERLGRERSPRHEHSADAALDRDSQDKAKTRAEGEHPCGHPNDRIGPYPCQSSERH